MNNLHQRSRTMIAVSLRAAAVRGLTGMAPLVDFVEKSCPFNRHDRHAMRIWHDELQAVLRAGTHGARPRDP